MKQVTAEIIRQICEHLDGCDSAWEGISYSAFQHHDDLTRKAVMEQINQLEKTIGHLRAIQAALAPVNHAALKRILQRIEDE